MRNTFSWKKKCPVVNVKSIKCSAGRKLGEKMLYIK